jgi:hypothetical protein
LSASGGCRLRDTNDVAGDTPASTAVRQEQEHEHEHEHEQEQENGCVNCGNLLLVLYRQRRWGVINAVAGGGGLITFPLLMLVTGPMTACRCAEEFLEWLDARSRGVCTRA